METNGELTLRPPYPPRSRRVQFDTAEDTFTCFGMRLAAAWQGLRAFSSGVLGKMVGTERWKEHRDRRKLHDEELHALCSSRDIIRIVKCTEDEMGWACGT
jgi:hypothetical protein